METNLENTVLIVKTSGERVVFSLDKLRHSLERSGAQTSSINHIIETVVDELYEGISTREIYNRAFSMLKQRSPTAASRYKLKKAIYELGPTGFPFERLVAMILKYSGYEVEIGVTVPGKCVFHEVDVIARKNGEHILVECKFHGEEGRNCNVKIPLYIYSRYQDILEHARSHPKSKKPPQESWVATNTRFTKDAQDYGKCMGLKLLSWDLPKNNGLKDRIDRLGLYPITVSNLLSSREKQFLLGRDIVLCRQLMDDRFFLDHLEVGEERKKRIMEEINNLCNS